MSALDDFNALDHASAVETLLAACHSRRWADAVAGARPFADVGSALAVADAVWVGLGPDDWREALDGHPRIGEQGGSSAAFSRQEQARLTGVEDDVRTAIARGNRDYEAKFGHIFLISAAGRGPQEILDNLRSRLDNDAATELREAAEQHRRITRIRLQQLLDRPAGP
jgi:2-oxo-4-hydroxy-4-carboxy-5-ureidoimidazoline decarboxylase